MGAIVKSQRTPRLYKLAAQVARDVNDGKGSIKQLLYTCKHPNLKAIYALVSTLYKRFEQLEEVLRKSKFLEQEPRLNPWLVKVLITELLWGKGTLGSTTIAVRTVLAYEQKLRAHLSDAVQYEDVQATAKPRYVRINLLKIGISEAIDKFRDEGWTLKRSNDPNNYLGFLEAVSNLGPQEFMVDFHIPYLLVFPTKTEFFKHEAYKNGIILLQDKASCIPAFILNPEKGSTVLDMCSAPGMKSTQCAAILENSGKVHALEITKQRFDVLKNIVRNAGATCVQALNKDALTLTGNDFPNTEYILVDPSCSGSGITDRVEIGQQSNRKHDYRLEKLAGFQIKLLRHALTRYPDAKRVVYSTCSVYPEENEDVVRQVLETCTNFKLVPASQFIKNWENFGSTEFGEIGNYCLYAKPDIDLTNGFFVAVFERLQEGERNTFLNSGLVSLKKKNVKDNKRRQSEVNTENGSNKTPKAKKQLELNLSEVKQEENKDDSVIVPKSEKKRKRDTDINGLKQEETTAVTPKSEKKQKRDTGINGLKQEKTSAVTPKSEKKQKRDTGINGLKQEETSAVTPKSAKKNKKAKTEEVQENNITLGNSVNNSKKKKRRQSTVDGTADVKIELFKEEAASDEVASPSKKKKKNRKSTSGPNGDDSIKEEKSGKILILENVVL